MIMQGKKSRITVTGPQAELLQSTARFPAFVAGFGSGKSEALVLSASGDASHSASALIGLYAPTYDLVKLILAPRMCERLTEMGIPHKWNKQDSAIYTSYPRYGDFIMRTMDNPERIVGYETYRAHLDELDTLEKKRAENVWNKVIARNRQQPEGIINPINRVSAYTTPEGFRFVYDRWKRKGGKDYQIIQAPTWSNPWLPEGYIDSLMETYPEELIKAYLGGEFTNLTSGVIYTGYKREACRSSETIRRGDELHIGQDFNVGHMSSTINIERNGAWHVVGELKDVLDTPELIETLKKKWSSHPIFIYPDASGKSRKTNDASKTDIILLRQAGFTVRAKARNPLVKDRILAINAAYKKKKLFVNDDKAPAFAEAQERQVYLENGEPDKKSEYDHPNDGQGYFVNYVMPVKRKVFTSNTQEKEKEQRYFKKGSEENWKTQ